MWQFVEVHPRPWSRAIMRMATCLLPLRTEPLSCCTTELTSTEWTFVSAEHRRFQHDFKMISTYFNIFQHISTRRISWLPFGSLWPFFIRLLVGLAHFRYRPGLDRKNPALGETSPPSPRRRAGSQSLGCSDRAKH